MSTSFGAIARPTAPHMYAVAKPSSRPINRFRRPPPAGGFFNALVPRFSGQMTADTIDVKLPDFVTAIGFRKVTTSGAVAFAGSRAVDTRSRSTDDGTSVTVPKTQASANPSRRRAATVAGANEAGTVAKSPPAV